MSFRTPVWCLFAVVFVPTSSTGCTSRCEETLSCSEFHDQVNHGEGGALGGGSDANSGGLKSQSTGEGGATGGSIDSKGGEQSHGGSDGSGGTQTISCEGSIADNPASLTDECGIFVREGASVNTEGKKNDPVGSITKAIELAGASNLKRIYACSGSFSETVHIDGLSLFGGLNCLGDWGESTEKTVLEAPSDSVPLTITGLLGSSFVSGFHVIAHDALAKGGSSIAILADSAAAQIENCTIIAANGADGEAGSTEPDDSDLDGLEGNDGADACDDQGGGASVSKVCPDGATSKGGNGGDGMVQTCDLVDPSDCIETPAKNGSQGLPSSVGGTSGTAQSGSDYCTNGGDGTAGSTGSTGGGAKGIGAIGPSGYTGVSGDSGGRGSVGGGGGGAGGRTVGECSSGLTEIGASGGSGGTGGCGGLGGTGGGYGGSSFGILSYQSSLSIRSSTIESGNGGNGGDGGAGQNGGIGGGPGMGGSRGGTFAFGCVGGEGGNGGNGGNGGGGTGGHSVPVAYTGPAPSLMSVERSSGTAGNGGGTGSGAGDSGKSVNSLEF